MIGFLPLTETGQFLQFWECGQNNQEGKIVFVPRDELLLVPGKTIHGGGFRADHRTDDSFAHLRLHFYVYPGVTECPFARGGHKNDYIVKSANYFDNEQLEVAKKGVKGLPESTLGNAFFHGYGKLNVVTQAFACFIYSLVKDCYNLHDCFVNIMGFLGKVNVVFVLKPIRVSCNRIWCRSVCLEHNVRSK